MVYELKIHLPQQIDTFFNMYVQGNSEILERVKKNITNIVNDKQFINDLMEYDDKKKERIVNTLLETKESVIQAKTPLDVNQCIKKLEMDLSDIEGDYWATVNEYITVWVTNQNKDQDE